MTTQIPFSQDFVLAVALDWAPIDEILQDFGVSKEEYRRLQAYEPFKTALAETKKVLTEEGVTTAFKAKLAVEGLLPDIYRLAKSEEAPPSVRLAAFQNLVKLSGLEKSAESAPGGFVLQIAFGGDRPTQVQPVVIEAREAAPQENRAFLAGIEDE
ncbi:MAG: hypothetical protein D6816_16980 [Bacteroidetes bacterium]|nr:MAG: hypothetical protein D6816_16980 [Bacteroidota bacterium]